MRLTGFIWLVTLIVTNIICISAEAQSPVRGFVVKYESSEYIYIDGGLADGISVGDTIGVYEGDSLVAQIEAVFVSEHSSSCKMIAGRQEGLKGLAAGILSEKKEQVGTPEGEEEQTRPEPEILSEVQEQKEQERTIVKGNAAIQLYAINDNSPANLDLVQPTFRFNLEIRDLYSEGLSLKIKSRTRYTDRTKRYNSNVPDSEWRNRVYEISIGYAGGEQGPGFKLGRIIPGSFSGVGYIDGLLVYDRFSDMFEIGAFTGTQPQWQYADFQTSIQKYGAYVNFTKGDRGKRRFESTLATVAEYHSSTVSREFIYLRNRISGGRIWSVYQSLDLDINRDWRKEKTGSSMELSNLYVSGNVNPFSWLRARLSYDNRKRYWYYEIQSLDKQLFDDRYRQGIKSDLIFRLPRSYFVSLGLGYRGVEGEDKARVSWSANLRKSGFTGLNLSYGLSYTGFSDVFSDGQRYSIKVSRYFRSFNIGLEYGRYSYNYTAFVSKRSSEWIRAESFLNLTRKVYMSLNGQSSAGDDINGYTVLSELGYRF
jgi:hypothetical protein